MRSPSASPIGIKLSGRLPSVHHRGVNEGSMDNMSRESMSTALEAMRSSFAAHRERAELQFWSGQLEDAAKHRHVRGCEVVDHLHKKLRKLEQAIDASSAKRLSENRKFDSEVSRRFGNAPFTGASATDMWSSKVEVGNASKASKMAVDTLTSDFLRDAETFKSEIDHKTAELLKRQEDIKKKEVVEAGTVEKRKVFPGSKKEVSDSKIPSAAPAAAKAPLSIPSSPSTAHSAILPHSNAPNKVPQNRKELVEQAWDLRCAHQSRTSNVEAFLRIKQYQKSIKQARVHINNAAGTIKDVRFRFTGEARNMGLKTLLSTVSEKLPKQLAVVQHIIADQFVLKASTQTSPEAIRHGESNFALAYLALAVMLDRPSFADFLMASLVRACPYCVPGLRLRIENEGLQGDERRSALGYKKAESESDYLLRMQAIIAWYGAILQTVPAMLSQAPYSLVSPAIDVTHPWGGSTSCWRWVAGTINGTKWRWTRSLLQAFLAVTLSRIGRDYPTQTKKLVRMLATSRAFMSACDKGCTDKDADRVAVFAKYVKAVANKIGRGEPIPPPGNPEDKAFDARLLPADVIENRG